MMRIRTIALSLFCITALNAQNPIIQTSFAADPAPMVYGDKVFIYTSHDEDETVNNFFTMYDWMLFSSEDMVNWTDHGAVASLKDFGWCERTNGAWAPQAIERNGKFYLYVPIHGEGISVLVADSPYGPFHDPLGHRLILDTENVWPDIDPTVFIDDDGQAYLFWGNPNLLYVRLNEDMISYDRSVGKNGIFAVEMTTEAFGSVAGPDGTERCAYTEGPWFYKRNGLYYLIYAASGIPEKIAYSTAPTPDGPWTFGGFIMDRADHLAFTNHGGVIDFKGKSYFIYHTQGLSNEGFKRSTAAEEFAYNEDGTIPMITPTIEGNIKSVKPLNPFKRVEAETIAWSEGVKTAKSGVTGVYVTKIHNGDYIKIKSVDLEKGGKRFLASVSSDTKGGRIEVRLGGVDGKLIASLNVENTGCKDTWKLVSGKMAKAQGVHDIYLVFKGGEGELFNFDWWTIEK